MKLKWGANLSFFGVKICLGGEERFDTVSKALEHVRNDIDLVAVHDAARGCITDEWIESVFAKAAETGAAMLACPIIGTVKKVINGVITETVDRSQLWEAQTPQVFEAALLRRAYASIDPSGTTDDASVVERLGERVAVVEGDPRNIKVTTPDDLAMVRSILGAKPPAERPVHKRF